MKKIVLIIASLTLSLNLIGQFIVKGVVLDSKDEPIAGANVYLKNTYDGTSTDSLGGFSFETSETGKQTLVVSFIGMKAVEKELELSHDYLNLQIQLKDDDSELQTIVISAGAFETGETVKSLVLKPMDIATTPSAVGDIYGALSSLPGSQIVGNEGGLFVRGGEGYETKTFVDGMPVVRPYMAKMPDIATRSNFSPLLFSGTVFSTGGYSAEFGQALSSALNLNTVGIANATESSLMLMSVGLNASHTQRWERSSLSVSLDYNDMGLYYPLVRKNMEWNRYPVRAGGTALYRMKNGKYGMLKIFGSSYWNYSSLKYNVQGDSFAASNINLGNLNNYLNGVYTDKLSDKWRVKAGMGFTHDRTNTDIDADRLSEKVFSAHQRFNLINEITNNISIKYGEESSHYSFSQNYYQDSTSMSYTNGFNDHTAAQYIESEINIRNSVAIRMGVRTEYSSLQNDWNISPRLSLTCQMAPGSQLSFAYGGFNQRPEDNYLLYAPQLKSEKATHYIVNYQFQKDDRIFRIEMYRKNYNELVKYESLYNADPFSYTNEGKGYAQGLDVFWRDSKSIKNLDYWLSYSFIDTKRDYKNNFSEKKPYYVSPHTFNAVIKYQVQKISTLIAATYTYASSKDWYNTNIQTNEYISTPAYHDISLSVTRLFKVYRKMVAVFANANNVLGFNHVYGYNYSGLPDNQGNYQNYPIKPMTKRLFVVGFYLMFK